MTIRLEDLEQWQQMRVDRALGRLLPEVRAAIDLAVEARDVEPLMRHCGLDDAEAVAAAEYALRPRTRARYRSRQLRQRTC